MAKLKLIWDFRGPASQKTAEHHLVHLKEYIQRNNLNIPVCGTEQVSEMHNLTYIVCNKKDMPPLRDSLKPHRGQLYQN